MFMVDLSVVNFNDCLNLLIIFLPSPETEQYKQTKIMAMTIIIILADFRFRLYLSKVHNLVEKI